MTFTTAPTFSFDEVLSSSAMNIIGGDINLLADSDQVDWVQAGVFGNTPPAIGSPAWKEAKGYMTGLAFTSGAWNSNGTAYWSTSHQWTDVAFCAANVRAAGSAVVLNVVPVSLAGSKIYFDLYAYTTGGGVTGTVNAFIKFEGW